LPGVSPSVGGFRNDLIIRGGAPNETVYYFRRYGNTILITLALKEVLAASWLNVSFRDVSLSASALETKYDNPLSELQFKQRTGNTGYVIISE
jgi:hypothetical protein